MRLCPFRVFVDADGNPLASGKIYTYVAGTTTNKATYTDSSGDTALLNPIILDAAGTKEIWLNTDVAYKFIIRTSANALVDTIDEILPINPLGTLVPGNIDLTGFELLTQSNGDVKLTPNGTGKVRVSSTYYLPAADGASTAGMSTDGTGVLSFTKQNSLLSSDSTPTLGGNLSIGSYAFVDVNLNHILYSTATASAVNYLKVSNNAAASAPSITATGSDTNVSMTISAKGTGTINITAMIAQTETQALGSLAILDHTNSNTIVSFVGVPNQVNYLAISPSIASAAVGIAPSGNDTNINLSLAGKGTGKVRISGLLYPSADGTNGQYISTDGSGNLSVTTVTPNFASSAEVVTGTEAAKAIAPGTLGSHLGVPHAWIALANCTVSSSLVCTNYDSTGTSGYDVTVLASYNCTAAQQTLGGIGTPASGIRISFTNAFSNTDYFVVSNTWADFGTFVPMRNGAITYSKSIVPITKATTYFDGHIDVRWGGGNLQRAGIAYILFYGT